MNHLIQRSFATRKESTYLLGLLLPIGLLLILFTIDVWQQRQIAANVQSRVTSMKSDGQAVTLMERLAKYDSENMRDETGDLQSLNLASSRHGNWWDRDVRDSASVIPQDQPWDAESYIDYRLEQEKTLLSTAPGLDAKADDFWMPTLFVDNDSYLRGHWSSNTPENLIRAFQKSYHDGDLDSALDWYRRIRNDELLRDSLKWESWNAQQLSELRTIESKPLDLEQRWTDRIRDNLSRTCVHLGLASDAAFHPKVALLAFGMPPSHIRQAFIDLDLAAKIQPAGTLAHAIEASDLEADIHAGRHDQSLSVSGFPFATANDMIQHRPPGFRNYSQYLTQLAFDQKWTVAAIAVRQYQIQEGKPPERIEDLRAVGLNRSDWQLAPNFDLRLERQKEIVRLSCLDVSHYMRLRSMNRLKQLGNTGVNVRGWKALEMQ